MAKRAATSDVPIVPTKIKLTTWGSGQTMYRVHEAIYAVDQFNPSPKGNAQFSPIFDTSGNVIPTLYAATTPRGALMESAFHDIPIAQDSSTSMPGGTNIRSSLPIVSRAGKLAPSVIEC